MDEICGIKGRLEVRGIIRDIMDKLYFLDVNIFKDVLIDFK